MPRFFSRHLLMGLAALAPFTATAQDANNPAPNLVNDAHTIRHNPAHKTEAPGQRFHTDRESGVTLPLPTDEDSFNFIVFGDRTGGPAEGVNILADAVHDANLIEPDLVMTVGDLVQGYNDTKAWMPQMTEYKHIMDHLLCPWFPVAGNHDVYYRGEGRTPLEHEGNYEMHFGPLWYAFEHRDCWFIVLYSDEPNPETGERNFHKAESQRMSPEQFAWLDKTLKQAKDARHVFLFLHHPRWVGGDYGNDWDRVHKRLVEAGNVSGVFAGHIHHMRYDPKDGIQYYALATVGGGQSGKVPDAGYLHQFHLVTVRQDQLAVSSVPLGELQDPKAITGQVTTDTEKLHDAQIPLGPKMRIARDGSIDTQVTITLTNPTDQPLDMAVTPSSKDNRWVVHPDHQHLTLKPHQAKRLTFTVERNAGLVDEYFEPLVMDVDCDYLANGYRFAIPTRSVPVPMQMNPAVFSETTDAPIELKGQDAILVNDGLIDLPNGPFTLEAWFNADQFGDRTGLVCKTQGSDYGIFVNNGKPTFSVHIGGKYVSAKSDQAVSTNSWHHVAGVFDGKQVRLYVDGKLVGEKNGQGDRKTNALPLVIGGDVNGSGQAVDCFDGKIAQVRLTQGARYQGASFTPKKNEAWDNNAQRLQTIADPKLGLWLHTAQGIAPAMDLAGQPLIESK